MALKLTIDVPDDLAARLHERAAAAGTTPEAVVAGYAADMLRLPADYLGFRRLAGTIRSEVTDASVRTDEYLTDKFVSTRRVDDAT